MEGGREGERGKQSLHDVILPPALPTAIARSPQHPQPVPSVLPADQTQTRGWIHLDHRCPPDDRPGKSSSSTTTTTNSSSSSSSRQLACLTKLDKEGEVTLRMQPAWREVEVVA